MKAAPIHDVGQSLNPYGRVIGVADSKAEVDAIVRALTEAEIPESDISYLEGGDGVHLLERAEGFFFSDAEESALVEHLKELKAGGFVIRVKAASEEDAKRIAEIAGRHGGKHFAFFGMWVVTQVT
jgi:hypothetical protein